MGSVARNKSCCEQTFKIYTMGINRRNVVFIFMFTYFCVFVNGVKICANGSSATCENGSPPVRDQDRSTPPCPGQGVGKAGKANTCADGSIPTKVKGQKKKKGKKQGRCLRSEKICCDGSSPSFDKNKNTPQCGDGGRAKCSKGLCKGP